MHFFQALASRSVITTKPLANWTSREEQIESNQFQLVPAEIAGIELLAKAIAERQPGNPASVIKPVAKRYQYC